MKIKLLVRNTPTNKHTIAVLPPQEVRGRFKGIERSGFAGVLTSFNKRVEILSIDTPFITWFMRIS